MKSSVDSANVIVIGAGLAGLSTASFLRMNGYTVTVLDGAPRAGGVALTRWNPSHTVEGGVYFFIEHGPGLAAYELYSALGVLPADDVRTVELYARIVDEGTGAALSVTRDLGALRRDLLALGPEDERLIDELVKGAHAFEQTDPVKVGFEKPPELQGFIDKLSLGWHARNALSIFSNKRLLEQTMGEWLSHAKSPALRAVLGNVFPHPTVAPWFVMMLLGLLARGQVGRVTSGADAFVGRLETRALSLGAQFRFGAQVTRILVEEGRATGVELADGSRLAASAVVATVDTRQLHEKLLGGGHADAHTQERMDRWPLTSPAAFVHFVVAGDFTKEAWLQQIALTEPLAKGTGTFASLRFFDRGTSGAGPDETVVQVSVDVKERDLNEAALVAGARRLLERHAPRALDAVRITEVVMPRVHELAVAAPDGVTSAWLPTPKALMAQSPRRVPGVERLYLAGQWAVAGAGVLAVLYSGRHAVQLLCHDEGKAFVRTAP